MRFIAKIGVHENAFIAKMGSCENACMLQKEKKIDTKKSYLPLLTLYAALTHFHTVFVWQ